MKYNITLILLLATALLFQSCIAKKYVRPEVVQENGSYRDCSHDTLNFATINWETYYADSNLVALIKMALDSNLDLRTAESNMRAAEEYFKQSKAAFFPTLAGGISAGVGPNIVDGKMKAQGNYSLFFETISNSSQASWEIDIWGKLAAAKRSKKASLQQSEAYYNAMKTQIVSSIASAYYSLLAMDAELQIYETSVVTREESLDILKALKYSDQSNEIAVNQGAAQLYYAKAKIPQIKINIRTTENLLSILLGGAPTDIKRSKLLDSRFNEVDLLKTGVPAQLLANRPDVMAAEYNLISAHEQWNYARASMYPSLVISGNIGFGSASFASWFSWPGSFVGNLIGSLTAPIFNNRKLKTQRNIAAETKLQAVYNFKNSVINAQKEVSDALTTYQLSNESILYQAKQVKELSNAVEGSLDLIKSGFASYLDLLYAEDNALSATIGLIEYHLQNAQSKIELYRALGGGWK